METPPEQTTIPTWGEREILNWFNSNGIFFLPEDANDPPATMKACFSVLVHKNGVLFQKVIDPDKVLDPFRLVLKTFKLEEDEVGVYITHDDEGAVLDYIEPYSHCKIDWLGRHVNDANLREQVLNE